MTLIKTSSTQQRFSRRALLTGIGASAAFLPLLHAEPAKAATANGFPRRLVTIAWTNGVAQTMFYPAADTDPTASPILTSFAALKSKVLLAAGLDFAVMGTSHKYDGHFGYPIVFTGAYTNTGGQNNTSAGPSLDQVVSDAFAKEVTLKLPLLNITLNGNSTSYRAAAQRNAGENNAGRLFTNLFASAKLPAGQVSGTLDAQKSVLDFAIGELVGFSKRMGTEDRAKIESHLDAVRKLELRLTAAPTGAACTAPAAPVGTSYDLNVKNMMDIAGMALRCDLTRVVSMVLGADGGGSPGSFPFLQVSGDYHALAHQGAAGYPNKSKIDTWYYQQVANLATSLDSSTEGLGTLLDNSVIVVGNDMSEGATHSVYGHGMLIVGSGGGYFKTGRVVRLGNWATKTGTYWKGDAGVAHNKLLASIGNAMGITMTGFGTLPGTLDELTK